MSSKHLRGDINYAWPTAEIAVMGAKVRAGEEERGERERREEEGEEEKGRNRRECYFVLVGPGHAFFCPGSCCYPPQKQEPRRSVEDEATLEYYPVFTVMIIIFTPFSLFSLPSLLLLSFTEMKIQEREYESTLCTPFQAAARGGCDMGSGVHKCIPFTRCSIGETTPQVSIAQYTIIICCCVWVSRIYR